MFQGVITIAGDVGSGKSTVGKRVAEGLGLPYLSTGVLQREIARSRGLTTLELNQQSMSDRAVDDTIDNRLRAMDQSGECGVVDARLGWHFMPRSFKVFLSVDPCEGARRTFAAKRPEERSSGESAALRDNIARRRLENARFRSLYSIECARLDNYDLVIDTTQATPDVIANAILSHGRARSKACLIAPRRLLPTQAGAGVDAPATDGPVAVLATEWFFVIVGGHARVSAALRQGLPLLDCSVAMLPAETEIDGAQRRQWLRDHLRPERITAWEISHGFQFLSHPDAAWDVREAQA